MELDLSTYERVRTRGRGLGIPVEVSGKYEFTVEILSEDGITWGEVARIPLQAVIESAEAGTT
jgi:hypothetical protein